MTARPAATTAALVLFIAFACNMLGRGIGDSFMVFVLPLSEEFGWKRAQVASVYSAFLVVTGLAAPLTGMLIDRWGPRVVYPIGVLLLSSSCLLSGQLSHLWQFQVVIGLLAGMGVSMLGMVPASMLISRWFRNRMSTAMGVAYAGFGTGTIVVVPLAQRWIELVGWRETYWMMGIGTLAALPLLLLLPWRSILETGPRPSPGRQAEGTGRQAEGTGRQAEGTGRQAEGTGRQAEGTGRQAEGTGRHRVSATPYLKQAMKTRAYWQIVLLFSFTSLNTFSVITQVVPFLVQSGLSPLEAAAAFGTAGLLSIFGIMTAGWAGDRFGYRATVSITFVSTFIGIASLLAFSLTRAPWLVVAFIICFGLAQGARGPIVSSLAASHFGGPGFATIYGTMFAWMSVAGAIGTLVAGFLYDFTGGYRAGFVFSMTCVLVAVSPFWVSRPLRRFTLG